MTWRFVLRLMCVEILFDGFLIYYFYTQPLMFFFKDAMLFFTFFFFMTKESTRDLMSELGQVMGAGIVLLMAGLIAVGFLQIFNPLSPGLLRGILGFKVMFLPWTGILLGYAYVNRTEDVAGLFRLIGYTSFPINIFGVIQYIKGPNFMPGTFGPGFLLSTSVANIYGVSYEESFVRIVGTFASSAHYSLFLAMNALVCLALFFADRRKGVWLIASVLNCFTLLGTGSRGGLLSTLLMVFIFAALFRRARPMMITFFIVVGGFFLGFSTLKESVSERFKTAADVKNINDRTVATAPKQFTEYLSIYPLGRGIGAAQQAARHLGKYEGKFYLVENYLSKLQLEMGIVGVVLFYLMILLILMRWFRTWLPPPSEDATYIFSIALTAYCFGQLTIGGIFSSIDTPPAATFIWIFMGMMVRIATLPPEYPEYKENYPSEPQEGYPRRF